MLYPFRIRKFLRSDFSYSLYDLVLLCFSDLVSVVPPCYAGRHTFDVFINGEVCVKKASKLKYLEASRKIQIIMRVRICPERVSRWDIRLPKSQNAIQGQVS